jgi:hypothetical protein
LILPGFSSIPFPAGPDCAANQPAVGGLLDFGHDTFPQSPDHQQQGDHYEVQHFDTARFFEARRPSGDRFSLDVMAWQSTDAGRR